MWQSLHEWQNPEGSAFIAPVAAFERHPWRASGSRDGCARTAWRKL